MMHASRTLQTSCNSSRLLPDCVMQALAEGKHETTALEPQQHQCTIERQCCPVADLLLKRALVLLRPQC